MKYPVLSVKDKKIYEIIKEEEKRQKEGIELIASENYVSKAVLETMSSVLANKYSEGYPGKRYYEGNEVIDKMEKLAIERAKELFDAEYVNVQPLSGSPANFAVYMALLKPGDTILAMKLDHGGHLSHGMHLNISGQLYNIVFYGVDKETERVDMEEVSRLAKEHQPKLIIAGFSAYSRNLDWQAFQDIADEVGAYTLADIAHIAGLIAGKQIDNPVPIFDVVTTTTHKTLRGPRGAMIMAKEKYGKDLNRAVFPGLQGGPHDHINAAKAVCFKEALDPSFQKYAKQVLDNTKVMAEYLEKEGLRVVSGGTDNHLVLVDLTSKNITGKKATRVLDEAGISTNMNLIPYDKRPPLDPSGLRLGTAAITTRGMKEDEVKKIVVWINQVLENPNDEGVINSVKKQIKDLTDNFPVPGIG